MIWKIIKRTLIVVIVLFVILVTSAVFYLKSVEVYVTEDALPEGVYDSSTNLNLLMLQSVTNIVMSDERDADTHIEFFMNVMIYKTIRDDINPEYDPIHGESKESQYIVSNIFITIDYMYVEMTEDNQLLLTVSLKRNSFPKVATAIYLYFDVDFNYQNMSLLLTLDQVLLDEKEIAKSTLTRILNLVDQEKIENSVARGTLDLDEYTYSVGFRDYLLPF